MTWAVRQSSSPSTPRLVPNSFCYTETVLAIIVRRVRGEFPFWPRCTAPVWLPGHSCLRLSCLNLAGSSALAQPSSLEAERTASERIREAEDAYENLEVEQAIELGEASIETGDASPGVLRRAYRLLGLARAAVGDNRGARDAYRRLLALEPDATLEVSVAPRLREPFYSARAYWEGRPPFGIRVTFGRGGLTLNLEDPLNLAATISVSSRAGSESAFQTERLEAAEFLGLRVPGAAAARQIEYYLTVYDEFQNTLLRRGTSVDPVVLSAPRIAQPAQVSPSPDDSSTLFEEPWFWVVAGVVVAAGLGVAVGLALSDSRSGRFVVDAR